MEPVASLAKRPVFKLGCTTYCATRGVEDGSIISITTIKSLPDIVGPSPHYTPHKEVFVALPEALVAKKVHFAEEWSAQVVPPMTPSVIAKTNVAHKCATTKMAATLKSHKKTPTSVSSRFPTLPAHKCATTKDDKLTNKSPNSQPKDAVEKHNHA